MLVLLALWAAIFLAAAATPSLLDDADATHSQAAQAMLRTGDWVTLHVNGIRYLEKPPLPYWIAASSLRIFGENSFAIHLPLALDRPRPRSARLCLGTPPRHLRPQF